MDHKVIFRASRNHGWPDRIYDAFYSVFKGHDSFHKAYYPNYLRFREVRHGWINDIPGPFEDSRTIWQVIWEEDTVDFGPQAIDTTSYGRYSGFALLDDDMTLLMTQDFISPVKAEAGETIHLHPKMSFRKRLVP